MDNKKNIKAIVFIIVWILLFCLASGGILAMGFYNLVSFPICAAGIFILITIWLAVYYVISRRYEFGSGFDPLTNIAENKELEEQVARMDGPKEGKDMYEVCGNLVKKHNKARIITGAVLSFILLVLVATSLIENNVRNIPLLIGIILVTCTVIVIIMLLSVHLDYGFVPASKLKDAITKQGFDADSVNSDFMQATLHDLERGLMAVGNTYFVVYSSTEFRVGLLENITKAEHYSYMVHVSRGLDVTRHYIRLHEKDNTFNDYKCTGKLAADLLLNRFLIENIAAETFPTGTFPTGIETPKGIW